MKCYAVIDTNVIVSSMWSKHEDAATKQVIRAIFDNKIVPLYNDDIMDEYTDVLSRDKFKYPKKDVDNIIGEIKTKGIDVHVPERTNEKFTDKDDVVFYEVVMEKRDEGAYLVTGNLKHFPKRSFVVTPAEMVEILKNMENNSQHHNREER